MRDDADDVITRLEQTVQRFTWALMECEPSDLTTAPGPDEWSPVQILAHIKAYDDVITARVATILTQDQPVIAGVDGDAWAAIAGYAEAPLDQTLASLQRHRNELVWQLRRLPDDAWDRAAIRTSGVQTLLAMLRGTAEHEEEHVAQLNDLLGLDDDDEEE